MKFVYAKLFPVVALVSLTACGGGGGDSVIAPAPAASAPVQTLVSYLGVSAGGGHTVAIKSDGTLLSWGLNRNGQVGDGTAVDKVTPTQVGVTTATKGSIISAGEFHTAALSSCATAGCALWVWGSNDSGRLGAIGNATAIESLIPVKLTGTTWISVAAGGAHTVGVQKDGSLWAWGRNFNGQLGDSTTVGKTVPTKFVAAIPNSAGVAVVKPLWDKVAVGNSHTLALLSTGVMYRWGGNSRGQLGINSTTNQLSPGILAGTGPGSDAYKYSSIAAGGDHSLAIRDNGELYAWGSNGFGQLGMGTTTDVLEPTQVGTDRDWESASAGGGNNDAGNDLAINGGHTVAIKNDGTLWAWGSNAYGQLGLGTIEDQSTPVKVNNETDWKRVSAGKLHTFAWKADGSLWGWGANLNGQLGNGSSGIAAKNILVPTRLTLYVTN